MNMIEKIHPQAECPDHEPDAFELSPGPPKLDREWLLLLILGFITLLVLLSQSSL